MKRYFITDFGLLNALGNHPAEIWQNWQQGISPGMQWTDEFRPNKPCFVCRVLADLPAIPQELKKLYGTRNNQLLMAAFAQIQKSVAELTAHYPADRIGIVLGGSTSGIRNSEMAIDEFLAKGTAPDWYDFKHQEMGSGAEFLKAISGIKGPALTISTACSSSANAFATARRLIDLDLCDAVIVGGADSLCKMTVQGFSALESVSDGLCQPFSVNRRGINIGEAVGLFIVDKNARNEQSLELYGVGCSSDAHHMSAPEPSGSGAIVAIRDAISQSLFTAADVHYLNLHGTATPLNDAMESRAVTEVFGNTLACSSTKSLTGHTLGAAAATELGFCCLLLQAENPVIPAQVWDAQRDPELPLIDIVSSPRKMDKLQLCMSNSFAFGGNNASLMVGKMRECM